MTAEEQLQYLSSRQAALDAQDYLSQGLRLDARISFFIPLPAGIGPDASK